jgi:PIN domain nuclease of toxin-antitoxin system
MKYLLDTHTLIWAITEPDKLSDRVRQILEEPTTHIVVSTITFWEISLKHGLGKLLLENIAPEDFPSLCRQMDIEIVPADADVCSSYHQLQVFYHRDPFDRMLVWQAKRKGYALLSKDSTLKQYETEGISIIW